MISVVIPFYNGYSHALDHLDRNLISLSKQKYENFEVIVSIFGDSKNIPGLISLLDKHRQKINITLVEHSLGRGISLNLNYGISCSAHTIVKILFQDDFLINDEHLLRLHQIYSMTPCNWTVSNSMRYDERFEKFGFRFFSHFSLKIIKGINTISSPSVVSFIKSSFVPFDINLIHYLDCDWYIRMYLLNGLPYEDKKNQIANGDHNYQTSKQISLDDDLEYAYFQIKYTGLKV